MTTKATAMGLGAAAVGLVCAAGFAMLLAPAPKPPPKPKPIVKVVEAPPKASTPKHDFKTLDPNDARALTLGFPDPKARDALVDLLYEGDRAARIYAVRGLTLWEDAGPDLFARLEVETDKTLRALLLASLAKRGTRAQIDPLVAFAATKDVPSLHRRAALHAVEAIYKRIGVLSPKEQEKLNAAWRAEIEAEQAAERKRTGGRF